MKMSQLKEIHVSSGTTLRLSDNLVKTGILPEKIAELSRSIIVSGETVVEGPIYAQQLTVEATPFEVHGAVFTQNELYISATAEGDVIFKKAVGSATSVVSRSMKCKPTFCSDINAKSIVLNNAFVSGSIYGDDVELNDCVVIGGVFATQSLVIRNGIIGTFMSPFVELDGDLQLLLPSVFSVESVVHSAKSRLFSLALADLGALYRNVDEAEESGRIEINLNTDEQLTTLNDEGKQRIMHSYSVVGKVLAADLVDTDKFQNHFLLTSAALGSQLLKNYDLGTDKEGKPVSLTLDALRDFFFNLLHGKIKVKSIDGVFNIDQFANSL